MPLLCEAGFFPPVYASEGRIPRRTRSPDNRGEEAETTSTRQAELEVPFALTMEDAEVRPEAATRGTAYRCPACGAPVVLRAGPQRRVHFAHKARSERCDFWTETEAHLRAKWRFAAAIEGGLPVQFVRRCESCSREHMQPLPDGIARASLEHHLPNGLRADVALLAEDGTVRAVIEVFATHECQPQKIEELAGTPWAEFTASEILQREDLVLRPRQDHFRRFVCGRCRAIRPRPFVGEARMYVDCPLPDAGRVLAVERCGPCTFFAGFDGGTLLCAASA